MTKSRNFMASKKCDYSLLAFLTIGIVKGSSLFRSIIAIEILIYAKGEHQK